MKTPGELIFDAAFYCAAFSLAPSTPFSFLSLFNKLLKKRKQIITLNYYISKFWTFHKKNCCIMKNIVQPLLSYDLFFFLSFQGGFYIDSGDQS